MSGTLPAWVIDAAAAEPSPPKPLLPSRPSGPEPATLSPLAVRRARPLQARPARAPAVAEPAGAARAERARGRGAAFLALPVHGLDAEEQDEIRAETWRCSTDPDLAELWGPDSQAEVPVVGLIPAIPPARRMRCRARSTGSS